MSFQWERVRAWVRGAPPRVRGMLVLCLVLGVMVAARGVIDAWTAYTDGLDEAIEMKALEYQRLSRNVSGWAESGELHVEVGAFRDEVLSTMFIQAATPSLAEAMFQHVVNEWAEKSGVTILTVRVLPRQDRENLSKIRMVINTRSEIGAIQHFMELVRQSRRFIFFEDLEIKSIGTQERRYFYFNAQLVAWTVS